MLSGSYTDPDNPIMLEDGLIVAFLLENQFARDSFNRVVPTMSYEEQERLVALAQGAPQLTSLDPHTIEDNFQHRMNTQVIRTSGPRGGGNWAPPPLKARGSA